MSPEEINRLIATRVAAIRQLRHLSREELAEKIGMTATKVGRVEQGSSDFTAAELVAVARALGVTTATLTSEERFDAFRDRLERAYAEANSIVDEGV